MQKGGQSEAQVANWEVVVIWNEHRRNPVLGRTGVVAIILMNRSVEAQGGREGPDVADADMMKRAEEVQCGSPDPDLAATTIMK